VCEQLNMPVLENPITMVENSDEQARAKYAEQECSAMTATSKRGLDQPERVAERARYIAETYAAHHRPLRSFLGRLLRNEDDIADTVQEVFLRIAQLPDPSILDLNPRAYLFRTAERLVIDKVRRDAFRRTSFHCTLDNIDVEQPGPSVESQVHWRRAMEQIVDCLRAAGARTAQVVELSCLHDLTHPEIADRLGVTTRTVERCMQRARQVCEPFYIAA
jgi:RNA polymerase sigma-70 factor (ECF subfamily)